MTHVQHAYDCGCCNDPQCYISVNKNRIKSNNGVVYLKNGTEFEIEFHNLTAEVQKAVITINGKKQQHALVLRPGEHFYLDRFMDDKKRLLFDVYTVDDAAEVRKAIESNGTVKVEFYREQPKINIIYDWYKPYTTTTYPSWTTYTSNAGTGGTGMNTIRTRSAFIGATTKGSTLNANMSRGMSKSLKSFSPDSSVSCFCSGEATGYAGGEMMDSAVTPQIETGRVEQGAVSDQDFRTVNYSFESYANKTVEFKLLPMSQQKTLSTKQIRSYCSCGRRIKKGWNVCPGCGQNLRSV